MLVHSDKQKRQSLSHRWARLFLQGLLKLTPVLLTVAASPVYAQTSNASTNPSSETNPTAPPQYKQLRYDEDWSGLRDPKQRLDAIDRIKYIPLREKGDWFFSIGGEVRERYVRFHNPLWGQEPEDNNGYFLQRYMLHSDFHLGSRVRVFAQIKSGLANGRRGGAQPADEDQLDLHQAFFDLNFEVRKKRSLVLRIGRQELAFGSSRLISVRESPNVRQSFDGVRATLALGDWKIDGLLVKPARTEREIFDDAWDHSRTIWGVYAVRPFKLLPDGRVDVYYLGLDRKSAKFDQGTAREVRHSVGCRIWGRHSRWDYNYELVHQLGSFGNGNIRAWTVASDNGYTISSVSFHPRLGLKADVTSGDRNPNNPSLQTFNALFPRGAYFGEIALIGPSNHMDLHPSVDLHINRSLTATIDSVFFWRTSLRDGIYGNATNLLRSGRASRARFVGSQPSFQLELQINRHLSWAGVVSHFSTGAFLKETGPSRNVNYASSWITYKF